MASIYSSCRRALLLLILLALALRVGFVLTLPNDLIWGDSRDYHQVALQILAGHGPRLHEEAMAFRPPGYPFFLAALYQLFGPDALLAVRLTQALLSALVVWQVFALAARLFKPQAGLLAALLVACDPFQIYFSGMILNETLFISLLIALLYALLRSRQHRAWLVAAGLAAGLGTLVKPSLLHLTLFLYPFLAVAERKWIRPLFAVAVVVVVQWLVLSPWLVRNHERLGSYTLTTMTGASLYEALGEGATGGPAMGLVKWPDIPPGLGEAERDRFLRSAALRHARDNPVRTLRLSLRKFSRFWSPVLNEPRFRTWKYSLLSAGWFLPAMALGVVAAWRYRQRWRHWLWLLAPVVYFTLLHSIFVGSVRYRVPIMPMVCCLAGAAFSVRRPTPLSLPTIRPTKLSVIVPFLNEARTLPRVVEQLLRLPLNLEVVLVNDGSTDGSRQIADELAASDPRIRALHHETKQGKGAAIRTALAVVTGDVVVIQDADLEYDPQDLIALWEPIAHGETPVIYGSRTRGSEKHSYASFYWGGQLVSWFCNLLFDSHLTDEPTCYKMIRTDLLRRLDLRCVGFEFCPEVTAKILRLGIPIPERPIAYRPRSFAEGKKIRWTDGLHALWVLLRYRFAD